MELCVSAAYERDPGDGLSREVVGPWVREKHQRLAKYVDISRGVRKSFIQGAGATYIELFSGPGRARIKDTSDVIDGSAIVAWQTARTGGAPFTEVLIADKSRELASAAARRLKRVGAPVRFTVGPARETVDRIIARLSPDALHVVFLDPHGLNALPFEVIAKLARPRHVDFLIHVSSQGLQRNLRRALTARRSALDIFAPGWRNGLNSATSDDAAIRSHFWKHWRGLLIGEGLSTAESAEKITGQQNQSLYWLAFAARHERALEFWEKIRNVSGQRQLGLL